MMKRISFFLIALMLLLVVARQAAAEPQSRGTSSLSGVVIGPDDKPVPHASVTYQSSDGTAPHAVHADSRGHFAITKLKSGNYDLRASNNGIFSDWEKNVMLRKGQARSLELHLIYAKEMPQPVSNKKPKQ